jgi:SAM-dependent methyltransferase
MDLPAATREEHLNRLVHVATYEFALPYTAGRRVLDLGCGTGYGAARVAETAVDIVGVDVCEETLAHAKARHTGANLTFAPLSEGAPLPFEAGAFDVVLSFQVIEHVDDPHAQLREIHRVLAPGGTLLLATPNRTARLWPFQRPWNRWHPTEYDKAGLTTLLNAHFPGVEVLDLSGDLPLVQPLLQRYRLLRWATLPVTLPGLPERLRQAGLGALRALQQARLGQGPHERWDEAPGRIRIGAGLTPSLHLVAVARRALQG